MSTSDGLVASIEAYYDAVPRSDASAEPIGPFTLFVGTGPWSYYARPTLGRARAITADDVRALLAHQRSLDVPTEVEWQPTVAPSLADACAEAGMTVHRYRVMVHDGSTAPTPPQVRMATATAGADEGGSGGGGDAGGDGGTSFAHLVSAQQQGFGGPAETSRATVRHLRERVAAGWSRMAAAVVDGRAVCVGAHNPVGEVSEVVGVATLPSHRRQGWAGHVTRCLADDAYAAGVSTVFLSAASDEVASVYARIGFVDIGEVCAAEQPERPDRAGEPGEPGDGG